MANNMKGLALAFIDCHCEASTDGVLTSNQSEIKISGTKSQGDARYVMRVPAQLLVYISAKILSW